MYASERLSFRHLGKASRGKPRRKPESGKPTFRDCRGARGNVTLPFMARCARLGSIPTKWGSVSGSGCNSPGLLGDRSLRPARSAFPPAGVTNSMLARPFHHQGTGRIRTVGGRNRGVGRHGHAFQQFFGHAGRNRLLLESHEVDWLTSTPVPTNGQILIGSLTRREILIRTISSVRPSTALRRKRKPKRPLRFVALRR